MEGSGLAVFLPFTGCATMGKAFYCYLDLFSHLENGNNSAHLTEELYQRDDVCYKPTLGDPMDCSQPGSSIHGILQARILEWVAISFSVILYYINMNYCR